MPRTTRTGDVPLMLGLAPDTERSIRLAAARDSLHVAETEPNSPEVIAVEHEEAPVGAPDEEPAAEEADPPSRRAPSRIRFPPNVNSNGKSLHSKFYPTA